MVNSKFIRVYDSGRERVVYINTKRIIGIIEPADFEQYYEIIMSDMCSFFVREDGYRMIAEMVNLNE